MREKLQTCLISAAIGACVAFGGVYCMITAFQMPVEDIAALLAFCLLAALVASALLSIRLGGWLLLAGVLAGVIWQRKALLPSLETLLYYLTRIYNMAYGTGIAGSPDNPLRPALCLVAGTVSIVFAWTICRKHRAFLAAIYGILPLAACMVVLDTIPDELGIFLVVAGLALLMITNTVRRRDASDGNRLTALLMVPVLLMTMLLFWAVPQDGYQMQNGKLQQALSDWFWDLPFMPNLPGGNGNGNGNGGDTESGVVDGLEVDLSEVGPNKLVPYPAMYIKAENSGMLYLRGQAYDVYTGTNWQVRKDLEGGDLGWPTENLLKVQTLDIQPISAMTLRFFPYYIQRSDWTVNYKNGRLFAQGQNKRYIYTQAQPEPGQGLAVENRLTDALYDHYTELPDDTAAQARRILRRIELGNGLSVAEKAAAIADYVQQTASYDLLTDRMPEGKQDFAIWFLEEGTTGYCVHFATAATVLLRAAEIPCRYVTGFLTWTQAGETSSVTGNQAHAWVEYYDPNEGWKVLESTPSDGLPQSPADMPTEPPTETTEPMQTTEPEDTTRPSQRPTTPEETTPDGTTETPKVPEKPKADLTWLVRLLKIVGCAGAALAALWLQLVLRRRWRYRRMQTGSSKRRTLARWREVVRMCRILKEEKPERLEELAEKAKFSQHRMTPEELREFDAWLSQARERFREKPCRLLRTLFWAV